MFVEALNNRIEESLRQFQHNNHDYLRLGRRSLLKKFKSYARYLSGNHRKQAYEKLAKIEPYYEGLETTWQLLSDDQSRDLLVDLMAYRVLGFCFVKLPTNTPEYWRNVRKYSEQIDSCTDRIDTGFEHFWLGRTRLEDVGLDVYIRAGAIMSQFFLHQYSYESNGLEIKVKPGDIVFDCGGCWGETAVHFASMCAPDGQVFSFEFIPSNLRIMHRNIDLNAGLKPRIKIIERPLWSEAEGKLYYKDNGPASIVKSEQFDGSSGSVSIAAIDQVVEDNSLSRVDFIKMDIEGAEQQALKGAEQSIRKFRPKLAICLYHSINDFCKIPIYLDSLDLGYRFHLHHATIHAGETVLFACVPDSNAASS